MSEEGQETIIWAQKFNISKYQSNHLAYQLRSPTAHIKVLGFSTWLKFQTLISCQYRTWEESNEAFDTHVGNVNYILDSQLSPDLASAIVDI